MASWRSKFKPWILARGQQYYECGQVVELEADGFIIRVEVSGSRAYHVEIHRSEKRVNRMSCDCPHAADGENCKHMAAVLMALDGKSAQSRMDWQGALAQMGEHQLRELLRSLAEGDGTLQDRVVRMISGPGNAPAQWQTDLEQIISDCTDHHGMYNELLTELTRYPYLGNFLSYEEDLRRWDSERTLILYIETLKREMNRACDRKQYRHVAAHLEKLKVYPNGREEAKALAAYWCVCHKNRPAMKDEPKKGGISAGIMDKRAASQISEAALLRIGKGIRKARSDLTGSRSDCNERCRYHRRNYVGYPSEQ